MKIIRIYRSGGGSGGSVRLRCDSMLLHGDQSVISAVGGQGGPSHLGVGGPGTCAAGGCGGDGRIAVITAAVGSQSIRGVPLRCSPAAVTLLSAPAAI